MRQMMIEWRWLVLGSAVAAFSTATAAQAHVNSHAKSERHVVAVAEKSSTGRSTGKSGHIGGGAKEFSSRGTRRLSIHGRKITFNDAVYYRGGSSKSGKMHFATRGDDEDEGYGGSLQCVPFARAASGIELKGNAADWWYAAAGVYDRGERPELGSVLNFRSTYRMRLGHVAVVTGIVGSREIAVDQANWAGAGALKGGVARGVHVIDVSPDNDWTEVRVAMGGGGYGSTYPTYGFIYDRPDTGTMMANKHDAPSIEDAADTEVAEAPAPPAEHRHYAAHIIHPTLVRVSYHSHVVSTSHKASRLQPLVRHISFGRG